MTFTGYLFIILAAGFWGTSGIVAKWFFLHNVATPLTVSQTRVFVGWATFFALSLLRSPRSLRVSARDLWTFVLLGIIGVAGANFGLYFAISRMDTAVADVIQFTAPTMVALWLWGTREESFDFTKMWALIFTGIGVGLALGFASRRVEVSLAGAVSAFLSAFCYAFLMIWGKRLSVRYDQLVVLHYAMLAAFITWCFVQPPSKLVSELKLMEFALLVGFGVISVVAPYLCFFAGLRRVPATGAGIVSTLEPVVMAVGASQCLGEQLDALQWLGIVLVLAGVVMVQLSPQDRNLRLPFSPRASTA